MIIGVTGTTKSGKTTFINDFMKKYPRYGRPAKSYRDIPNLSLYQNGSEESQRLIRDFMFDQIRELWSKRDTNRRVILDRTLLDNLAITMILYSAGNISDEFLEESIEKTKKSMQYYHCIYFIPLDEDIEVNYDEVDFSEDFRLSLDVMLTTYYNEFEKGGPLAPTIFPETKCAFLERVEGTREGRINYVSEILDENGDVQGGFEEGGGDNPLQTIVGADGMPAYSEESEFDLGDFGFETEKLEINIDS